MPSDAASLLLTLTGDTSPFASGLPFPFPSYTTQSLSTPPPNTGAAPTRTFAAPCAAAGRNWSGLPPRVLGWLSLSFLPGAGACSTCAAVMPDHPFVVAPGLRSGGVAAPASTGNSSALGSRCGFSGATAFLSARWPFTVPVLLEYGVLLFL